jgi:hypothetical protein
MRLSFGWIVGCLSLGLLISCARVVAPTGGPEDKVPPKILAITPKDGSVRVPLSGRILVEVNEWIDPASASALVVSPPLAKTPRTEVHGTLLEIDYRSLDSGTTYQFDLGSIKDLRGNPMGSQSLIFSTGSVLDSQIFRGRVVYSDSLWQSSRNELRIALYPIGQNRSSKSTVRLLPDSLRADVQFDVEQPYYQATTDSLGYFELRGLAVGSYHALAYADLNLNRRLDLGEEPIGLAESKVEIPGSAATVLLSDASIQSVPHVSTQWLIQDSDSLPRVIVQRPPIRLDSVRWEWDESTILKPISLERSQETLTITFDRAPDEEISTTLSLDSQKISLRWAPSRDSASSEPRSIQPSSPLYLKDTIRLSFESPLRAQQADGIQLMLANQKVEAHRIQEGSVLKLIPKTTLPTPSKLSLVRIENDTSVLKRWEIPSIAELANLTGDLGEEGPWVVELIRIEDRRRWLIPAPQGRFKADGLPQGQYLLQAFLDQNGNQRHDPGSLKPWLPAETWLRLPTFIPLQAGNQNLSDFAADTERTP